MGTEPSIFKKWELAWDDLIGLWKRRKGVFFAVVIFAICPTGYSLYQQFSVIPRSNEKIQKLEATVLEAVRAKELAEIKLAPFQAVANANFPSSPVNQRLELLADRLEKAIGEAFRYNLPPEKIEGSAALFAAGKFFFDDLESTGNEPRWHYRRLVTTSTKGLAPSLTQLLRAATFRDFLELSGVKIEVMPFADQRKTETPWPNTGQVLAASNGPILGPGSASDLYYVLFPNLELRIDERVLRSMEEVHFNFKRAYTETVRDALNASKPLNKYE